MTIYLSLAKFPFWHHDSLTIQVSFWHEHEYQSSPLAWQFNYLNFPFDYPSSLLAWKWISKFPFGMIVWLSKFPFGKTVDIQVPSWHVSFTIQVPFRNTSLTISRFPLGMTIWLSKFHFGMTVHSPSSLLTWHMTMCVYKFLWQESDYPNSFSISVNKSCSHLTWVWVFCCFCWKFL